MTDFPAARTSPNPLRQTRRALVLFACLLSFGAASGAFSDHGSMAWIRELPWLRYGHVMFNQMPRVVETFGWHSPEEGIRPLSDLVQTQSLGYQNARTHLNAAFYPRVVDEICSQEIRNKGMTTPILIETQEFRVEPEGRVLLRSTTRRCGMPPMGW